MTILTVPAPESSASWIDQPEPGLTEADLISRARELRPMLRERQNECEQLGQVLPDVAARLIDAGFFRMVQPRRFGGYEFDIATFYKVVMELARGCSETAWVVSLVGGHPVVVANYPEKTQVELYGADGDFRCPGALTPPGKATPVEGGYRITHSWVSASGIDVGTHFMALATVGEGADMQMIQLMIDIDQCTTVDDWNVMGMRGTGSKRVNVEDVFVPAHRAIVVEGIVRGAEPKERDAEGLDNPIYWGPIGPFLIGETAAVAVGAARGALDAYEDLLRSKKSNVPPFKELMHGPVAQHHYGTALSLVSTAEAALVRAGEEYVEFAREWLDKGIPFDNARAQRLTLIVQRCTELAWEAIELIYRTAGTSASAKNGMPIGRFMRNVAVLRTHPVLQYDQTAVNAARTRFGLPGA